jgi:hypothetical protein
LAGPGLFVATAAIALLGGAHLLEYPKAWAGPLMLVLETVLAISIAVILTIFFPPPPKAGDGRHPGAQLIALAREDERRIRLEVRNDCAQSLGVGVLGLLRRGQVSPGVASAGAGLSVHGHDVNITGSCPGSRAMPRK